MTKVLKIVNKLELFIILIHIVIQIIKCDGECDNCTGENCEGGENCATNNCKYFEQKKECFPCSSSDNNQFYACTITPSGEGETISCESKGETDIETDNLLLIYNTKELVTNCKNINYFQLGSICYENQPNNAKLISEDNNNNNKYECLYSFTKIIENNLEYINCLNKGQSCPSDFNYITINQNNKMNCSKECFPEGENPVFIYQEKNEQNNLINYCLGQCPSTAKYYYEPEDGVKIINCLENCNSSISGGFYNVDKCVNSGDCDGYIKVDLNKNNFECITTTFTSCNVDYPYLYQKNGKNYCLKNCLDTQKIQFFGNIKTYLYENDKECLDTKDNHYKDELSLKLISDCKNSLSGPYHNNTDSTCYQACDNYKKDLECVNSCVPPLFTDEETKTCYNECPSNLGRGFQKNNICQSCNPGEGFYKENDNKCYENCDDLYYNDGDNFCFAEGCNNNPIYKYHANDGNICYKSCADIKVESEPATDPKTYIYPYLYEKDNICYKQSSDINLEDYQYFYLKVSGITKYIKEEDTLKECFEANLKYLKGTECIDASECNEFIVLPTQSKLGKCLTINEVQNNQECKYYNNTKICSDECKFLKIIKANDDSSNLNENCVINCPSGYIENVDTKTCEKSCNSQNPYTNQLGKCVSKCETGFYKVIMDEDDNSIKKCVNKCIDNNNNGIYLHYLQDGQCVDSCFSQDLDLFSYEAINDHQPCINECPNDKPFYNVGNKICLENCEYYQEGKCVDKCDTSNYFIYLHPGNICSKDDCKSNAPFRIDFNFNLEGTDNQVTKCVSSCIENNFAFYENSNKKCTNSCLNSNYVIYEGACLDQCPEGLYKSEHQCVSKCEHNFYKRDGSNSYECIESCNIEGFDYKYTTTSGECKKICPIGENYIDDNNNCLTNNTNKYYEEINVEGVDYKIYKIITDCSYSTNNNNLHIFGQKECISDCSIYNLYKLDNNICNNTCYYNGENKYSTIDDNGKKVCNNICHSNQPNYEEDLICKNGCNSFTANIINDEDNSCVNQCDLNSTHKFLQQKDDKTLHCKDACDGTDYRYFNYKCAESCDSINNFVVVNTKECLSKCPEEKPYYRKQIISSDGEPEKFEYICSDNECISEEENKEYYNYLNDKMCLTECNDYIKEGTNICTKSCDVFTDNKYFYESETENLCISNCTLKDKPFTLINNTCVENCNNGEFYNEYDKICRIKCPANQKIDIDICRENCITSENNKYEDENGICVEKCENSKTGYIYYNADFENKCQNNCSNKYIKGNTCVNSCEEDEINTLSSSFTKFLDENVCVQICPITKRFVVYNPNEENIENNSPQYKCLTDCPINYTYYSIITNNNFIEPIYSCKNNCPAYILNNDPNINARFCFDNGICLENNLYYINGDNNNKQCLSQCPSDKPYYKSDDNPDFQCLSECPDNYAHMPDKYVCEPISDCESKKINYIKKECVNECPRNYKIFKKNDIIYCIENCTVLDSSFSGATPLLLTNEDECVSSCPTNTEIKSNNICDCIKLFYYDKSTGKKICLSSDKDICKSAGIDDYKISIADTNECSYYCDGVLSASGYECYRNKEYNCSQNEKLITLNNGDKVCDCIDKYYYAYNDNGKEKKCLDQGDNCNSPFELLITETKECVNICPDDYKYKFQKTCVSSCPESTKKDGKKCICEDKWYIDKNSNKAICLKNNCTEEYPLLISDTRQCVSSCIGTGYDIYYDKECIQNCNNERTKISTDGDSFAQKYAEFKCKCNSIWYYDEFTKKEECHDGNDENDCNTFSNSKYKYKIESTKQCVSNCNGDFPYEFNNLCFKNCEDYTEEDLITQDNQKKCICREYSELTENNDNEYTKCLTLEFCKNNKDIYSLIEASRQCYKKENDKNCPKKYPIYFNGYCYKENDCPENTNYNPYEQKCKCNYKWYNEATEITCLPEESNCPSQYPLLVFSTDECKKDNDLNLLEFNYILYGSCPKNTIKSETSNECICDNNNFWYEDQTSDGKKFLYCGLEECPNSKPYINEGNSNKECIPDCGNKYLYRGICYEKCPELTEVGNNNECVLSPVNNEITLDKLEQTITSKLVELYKKSNIYNEFNSTSSQKIVTTNATVEFYGVNKNNKGKSEDNIQSDLSYIDISECVEKIYKSNGMKNDDDIIILKFDLNNAPENFLINPVEYKFVNSRTGQELDASVCEHNSIKISYPLHNLIYRYDNRKNKKRKLEYMQLDLTSNNRDSLREKLDKGKEIREKYSYVDIFNINDILYSDICIAFEVDGKDLLLQDRINYLYPDMSLCENNCTYNHTDFINERIYCDCSFKKEFDFKREYSSSIEINTEQIKNDQGSNSNINVIKCISNLKNKKSLSGNGGFIFLIIVIIIEFILLLIIIFYGIGSLLNKLKKKMKKDDNEEYDKIELNVVTTNNNNNDKKENENEKEKEKETQRKLNVPPKKKGEYGMEFIPQEYVFLFFNQNEKGVIKKVERDGVPFKTNYNTRILLEKIKGVNYDNIKSRGPFPGNQNVLVIVDNMNDSLSDYIYDDESDDKFNNRIKNTEENNINNNEDDNNKTISHKNKHRKKNKNNDDLSEKFGNKAKMYSKKKMEYSISDYDPSDENYSEIDFDEDENNEKGFIESIKKEQRLIKKNYDIASQNQKSSNFITMLFTEIIDKIYITKILLFTRKFDILSLQLSIYFLCHTLLLILLALFYDIKTIEKIWNKENYPGLGYYLLYGLISCIIIWIIYTIILCLWSNNDKIKEILRLIHASQKYGVNKENIIRKKYNSLSYKIKFKIAIYTFIEFLLLAFCFIYFVTFCTVYTGTMNKVFKSYGIALIEVLIIKIIYGIVLAILRRFSLNKGKKTLYDVVLFMDTYLV